MNFELLHTDPGSSARAGLISTDHGTIETPIFMPVGTVGSVKGVFHRDLADEAGAQIIPGQYLPSVPASGDRYSREPAACIVSARGTVRF